MKQRSEIPPASLRTLKAFAVVLALLIVVPGADAVVKVVIPSQVAKAADVGLDAATLLEDGDVYAVLDRIEDFVSADNVDIPDVYAKEVGFLDGAHDIRVGAGGSVVGYTVSGEPLDILSRLTEQMESSGWKAVSLGGTEGATFVRQSGSCTWALVTCMQVGSETSVVVRCLFR